MERTIAKCGCDCLTCPTYKDNVKTIEDRKKCSEAWQKYINIKLSPEKLRACDGCSLPDSERKTYYLNCKIRKCAMLNEIENCAYCSGFPCTEIEKAHSLQKISNREQFIKEKKKDVSEDDYRRFIEPYAGLNRLMILRKNLNQKEFKDFKKFSLKTKKHVKIDSGKENINLKMIITALSALYVETGIPYARLLTLEKKREQVLKIFWTMLINGKFTENYNYLELDANTYSLQKINGMYNILKEYINDLRPYDIHLAIVPLATKGWLTPMGGLRKQGWVMRLSFGESLNGNETLKDFYNYANNLNNNFGNKAFRTFTSI